MLRVPRDLHLLFESSASVLGRVPCHYFRSSRDLHTVLVPVNNTQFACVLYPQWRVTRLRAVPMREVRVVAPAPSVVLLSSCSSRLPSMAICCDSCKLFIRTPAGYVPSPCPTRSFIQELTEKREVIFLRQPSKFY